MSHFSLRTSKSSGVEIVVSVSKKVAKNASDRNLIKRRIRPIIRSFSEKLPPAKYMVIARDRALDVKGQVLKDELRSIFGVK